MKRRHFLQSSLAAAVAASLPTSQALAAALAAMSEVSSDVNAVTGAGAQVTLEKAAVKELSDALRGRLLLPGSFNPVHEGHRQMLAIAEQMSGLHGAFELAVRNADRGSRAPACGSGPRSPRSPAPRASGWTSTRSGRSSRRWWTGPPSSSPW